MNDIIRMARSLRKAQGNVMQALEVLKNSNDINNWQETLNRLDKTFDCIDHTLVSLDFPVQRKKPKNNC